MKLSDAVKKIPKTAFVRPGSRYALIVEQAIDAVEKKLESERIERLKKGSI